MERPADSNGSSLPNISAPLTEKGIARLGKAAATFTADAALAALGPMIEAELRERSRTLWHRYAAARDAGNLDQRLFRQWNMAAVAADSAGMLAKSSTVREYVRAYAKLTKRDPFTQTREVIESWSAVGCPAPALCPECGERAVHLPGEPEDAEVGLGARDAGLACTDCEWDSRACHPPKSRGSDAPFLS